jgi:Transposase DDE domain
MDTTSAQHYIKQIHAILLAVFGRLRLDPRHLGCFAILIMAAIVGQTANLSKLSVYAASPVKKSSIYRRFQNFFRHVRISQAMIASYVFHIINISDSNKAKISIDRTEWKFATVWHNLFVASVVFMGVSIPFMWVNLAKKGASSDKERLDFLFCILAIIPPNLIDFITMDREFASNKVFEFLAKKHVPFDLRMKMNTKVLYRGKLYRADFFGKDLKPGDYYQLPEKVRIYGHAVWLSILKTSTGELLILATSHKPSKAFQWYADRWQIECCFKALKTHGFNIEDTHLKDPERVETLMGVLVMAYIFAYKVGILRAENEPIEIKKHGRPQYSIITYGLEALIRMLLYPPTENPVSDDFFRLLSCT